MSMVVEVAEVHDGVHERVPVEKRRDDGADAVGHSAGDDEVAAEGEDDHLADEAR